MDIIGPKATFSEITFLRLFHNLVYSPVKRRVLSATPYFVLFFKRHLTGQTEENTKDFFDEIDKKITE